MKVKVDLNDFDIFLELYSFNGFRAGVLTEFLRHFDEHYEFWQEEDKQKDIDKIIYEINDELIPEYKKSLINFMERLTDKLKEE